MTEETKTVTVPANALVPVVTLRDPTIKAVIPRDREEAIQLARDIHAGQAAPKSFTTVQQVYLGVLKGLGLRLEPVTALAGMMVVNNRVTLWGDLAWALVLSSGLVEWYKEEALGEEPTDDVLKQWPSEFGYRITLKRRGQDNPYVGTFRVRDAVRAKLWMNTSKAPWMEHPLRMLKMRARAFAMRDGFADVLSGMMIAEEAMDEPPPPVDGGSANFLDDDAPALAKPEDQTAAEIAAAEAGAFSASDIEAAAVVTRDDGEAQA